MTYLTQEQVDELEAMWAYDPTPPKADWSGLLAWVVIGWVTLTGLTIFGLGVERLIGLVF